MESYHKIQSIYKRDEKTKKFIEGKWSVPEFEYLQDNDWVWTEKIDGTNIRVIWDTNFAEFKGKTEKSQLYAPLVKALLNTFTHKKMEEVFDKPICLYGEGYGAHIQIGGGNYRPDVGFILFDIKVDTWWLRREDLEGIAERLGIPIVPIIGYGTLHDALWEVKKGVKSTFGDFLAEGLVLKPKVEMSTRSGNRIMTKIKHRDFSI